MTLLGNMLWFILAGWWSSLYYTACGVLCCITIIGIPIGKAMFQYAKLMAAPFGKVIVKETDLKGTENVSGIRRFGGTIANILWLPVGIITFLGNIGLMIACTISIVGIPAATILAKSCKFLLWPVGAKVVTKGEYEKILLRRTVTSAINDVSYQARSSNASHSQHSSRFAIENYLSKPAGIGFVIGQGLVSAVALLHVVDSISSLVNGYTYALDEFILGCTLLLSPLLHLILFPTLVLSSAKNHFNTGNSTLNPTELIDSSSIRMLISSTREALLIACSPSNISINDLVSGYVTISFAIKLFLSLAYPPYLLSWLSIAGLAIGAKVHKSSQYSKTPSNATTVHQDYHEESDSPMHYSKQHTSSELISQESPDVLTQSNTPLWMPGLPIIVTKADIVKRYSNFPEVSLRLEFQNLCDQPIIAVYFSARCYNLLKQELSPIEKQSVQDFTINPGCFWTSSQAARCPANDTRRIELTIHNVVMADGSIWSNETEEILQPLPKQDKLEFSVELFSEMHRLREEITDFRNTFNGEQVLYSHLPVQTEHYWQCACGQINLSGRCLRCNVLQGTVFDLTNAQNLAERVERRLAEQQQVKHEKKQARIEKIQITKQALKTFWDKTILQNKKKIIIFTSFVFGTLVLGVISLEMLKYYQAYRAEQEEAARIQLEQQLAEQKAAEEENARRLEEAKAAAKEAEEQLEELTTEETILSELAQQLGCDMSLLTILPSNMGIAQFGPSDEGIIRAVVDGFVGYINEYGEVLLAFEYLTHELGNFSEGKISYVQRITDEYYEGGYIEPNFLGSGFEMWGGDYCYTGDVSEGFAAVSLDNKKYGYINSEDHYKLVIPYQYDFAGEFCCGLACVAVENSNGIKEYGYIDKSGEYVIPPQYIYAESFSENLALVAKYDSSGNLKYGYINQNGSIVIPLKYVQAGSFSDGLACVGINDETGGIMYGYINQNGATVIPFELFNPRYYFNGAAEESYSDSSGWGTHYIDPTGRALAVSLGEWDGGGSRFYNGLACVKKWMPESGCWMYGYIDHTGKVVIPFVYSEASGFNHNGLASVCKDGLYGYIDREGNTIIPLEFDGAYMVTPNTFAIYSYYWDRWVLYRMP